MKYRADIDGLRAVAVISVILFHAGISIFSGGYVGVDVFFVISGYLITNIILKEKEAGHFSLIDFYERRTRRILPALFLVIFCCIPFVLLWLFPGKAEAFGRATISTVLFVSNFLFWRETGYFADTADESPLLHTWSLSVEEQFYLLFPLCVITCWKLGKRWLVSFIAIICFISLALSQFGGNITLISPFLEKNLSFTAVPSFAFFLPITRAWELLIGSLAAFHHHKHQQLKGKPWHSALGLICIFIAIFYFDNSTPFPSFYTLLPVVGTALILLYNRDASPIRSLLELPPLVKIGLISYSAYLWHQPIFAFARIRFNPQPTTFYLLILCVFILAYLSWKYVEKPFRNKHIISRKFIFTFSFIGSLFLILIGTSFITTDGYINRYKKADKRLASIEHLNEAQYVIQRFLEHKNTSLPPRNSKTNIVLIGDSFAQDFHNILAEGELLKHSNIATHFVRNGCGNIWTDELLESYIEQDIYHECISTNPYQNKLLLSNLERADIVFLATAWKEWEVKKLGKSITRIKQHTKGKIYVVGKKELGQIDIRALLSFPPDTRRTITHRTRQETITLNQTLSTIEPKSHFIDLQSLLCNEQNICDVFDNNIDLISYDGSHLTREGAVYLGAQLKASFARNHPTLKKLLLTTYIAK